MAAVPDVPMTSTSAVSQAEAQRTASAYVTAKLDPAFVVVLDTHYHQQPQQRTQWRFFVRCAHGPLTTVYVDAQTGAVLPLTGDEIRVVREKAAILTARQQGILPVDTQGYVLGEYARRRANGYLSMEVSLFYSATDGIFVPLARPVWQFSIEVRLPKLGALGIMGAIDVDAQSGEVIPLTHQQIKRIRERADALVEFRTQTTAA
jgi:hypothetical protein